MAVLELLFALANARFILVAVLTFLLAYLFIAKSPRLKHIPPGPWCFPVFGYLANIAWYSRIYGTPLPVVLNQLSKRYGPLFSLYLGDQLCVVLNSQEVIREAFMNPKLNDRPTASHFQNNEATGIINASGPDWKAQRAFTLGIFRRFGVGKAVFENHICSELNVLLKEFEAKGKMRATFNPTSLICMAISNITSRVTVAKRYKHGDQEFKDLMDVTDRIVKLAGTAGFKNIIKLLRLLPSKANEKLGKAKNDFMTIVNGNIQRRRSQFHIDDDNIECLIDVYLKKLNAKEELDPHINNDTVAKTVASLFMAGTDTSTYQILWVFVHLLRHPDVMKTVQDEIDDTVGRDRLPTMTDKDEMPFTQAVISECMRMAPPVPMGVMHTASEDTTLLEYNIPKGTLLISNIWGVHNHPDIWPEPSKFDPSRFLDEHGQLVEKESLIPFSAGRRVCVGENLARMEIFMFVTQILHQFDLNVPVGEPTPSAEGLFQFNYCPKPFGMTVKKRASGTEDII